MAIFLETNDLYRMFQRELPEGVYPEGAPSGSFSGASLYAKATLAKEAYDNMERIYDNYFPQTADEKISDWETTVFGRVLTGLTLVERRAKVLFQLRNRPGITKQDMINVVKSVIGDDKDVAIAEWGCTDGTWIIGVSELGVTTILGGARLLSVTTFLYPGVEICDMTAADVGMTEEDWQEMKTSAYTYSVLIYDYTLTDAEREEIDNLLTLAEPARSAHVIYDGLDPAEHI